MRKGVKLISRVSETHVHFYMDLMVHHEERRRLCGLTSDFINNGEADKCASQDFKS